MLLGFDIGGTKCAVITARYRNGKIQIADKVKVDTDLTIPPEQMIQRLIDIADDSLRERPEAIGISCGGPLDSRKGIILGPPNLPEWGHVEICKILRDHYQIPAFLQNDANACAVAEWKFGAGRGCRNMVFLTFGTGLGAGLILDGRLYSGTNDNAGECGHIRLDHFGPIGYGKIGSFEGFCSGGGLAQLGYLLAVQAVQQGQAPSYCTSPLSSEKISAKVIAEAANAGDPTAQEVFRISGEYLGKGLAILIDILNPERIVIGSIFARCENLLKESMLKVLEQEALPQALACCKIVPAELGEEIGDYASIATALLFEEETGCSKIC